jgi:MFS family permease
MEGCPPAYEIEIGMDAMNTADRVRSAPVIAGGYRFYALFVIVLVGVFNAADRGILPILAEQVKADLAISDAQLAVLHGAAFVTLYTLLGIPAARLADRMSRPHLLAAGLAIWSCSTVFGAFASRFETLASARLGVGVGEATANPTTHSMLCDYFPVRLRSRVIATYLSGLFIGGGIATTVGGHLVGSWANQCGQFGLCSMRSWQTAFLIMGVPGLLLALLVVRLREPVRGASEGAPTIPTRNGHWHAALFDLLNVLPFVATVLLIKERASGAARRNLVGAAVIIMAAALLILLTGDPVQWIALGIGIYAILSWCQRIARVDPTVARLTLQTRSFVYAILGFSALGAMTGAVHFWMFPYAIREFGVSAAQVGLTLGPITAIGAIIGALGGSAIADIMRARDPRGYLHWSIITLVLFSLALVGMIFSSSLTTYTVSALVFTIFSYAWSAASGAQVQDLVLPRMRATTSAINALSITLATLALGPYWVGRLAGGLGSLLGAMLSILLLAPVAGLLLWIASRTVAADQSSKWERADEQA